MANTANLLHRKSFLTLTPVDFSLTAGTDIPAPAQVDTPPETPATYTARPPTAGGGPLNSHPTSPEPVPGAFPPTPEPEKEGSAMAKVSTSTTSRREDGAGRERSDSLQTPISPSSSHQPRGVPTANGRPQTQDKASSLRPRKLFSLGNLRQSFSSSRTSLAAPRPSTDSSQPASYTYSNHLKRPSSPASSTATPRPRTTRTKSGNWFRRKSGLFMLNGDGNENAMLDAVAEDQTPKSRPETRDSAKRMKENHSPAPLLPEIGGLSAGGELGWDEDMFKR